MLFKDIVDLYVTYLTTILGEGQFKILPGDLTCVVNIKRIENTSEMTVIFSKHLLDI
jgi:hypothetical protein